MNPARPRGVHLLGDGINIRLDDRLVYVGRSSSGIDTWKVLLDEWDWTEVLRGRRRIHVDRMPPHCYVGISRRD